MAGSRTEGTEQAGTGQAFLSDGPFRFNIDQPGFGQVPINGNSTAQTHKVRVSVLAFTIASKFAASTAALMVLPEERI